MTPSKHLCIAYQGINLQCLLRCFFLSKAPHVSIDYRPSLNRYIKRLSSDYLPSVDLPSTECRPITDRYIGQVSTNYRRSVSEMSAISRRSVGEQKAISAETHLEQLSTVSRPSVDRLSTAISTNYQHLYRPTVDRVSTECQPQYWPLYRPISQSTLPTVSKSIIFSIKKFFFFHGSLFVVWLSYDFVSLTEQIHSYYI